MRLLIVEDESLAASRLEMLFKNILNSYEVVGIARSIEEAITIIDNNDIDLGFFDIQIEDGLSFDIFERINVNFPVIFTTAYNDYAIRAFKLNSIDYLLKPISEVELKNAISKFENIWNKQENLINISVIDEMKQLLAGNYKERFIVKIGNRMEILNTDDISYFYSFNKGTYAHTNDDKDFLLDIALDIIFPLLNPANFFRISRKHIINIKYIKDIYSYSNSRLVVNTKRKSTEEMIVSREKVRAFKDWLENSY
jgi:two-component system response regulator LytT